MRKLVFTPDENEILKVRNPNAMTCICLTFYHKKDVDLESQIEVYKIMRAELGSPYGVVTFVHRNRTIAFWIVTYREYKNFFERNSSRLYNIIQHNKDGVCVYGGIPEEAREVLEQDGWIVVSSDV